MRSSALLAFLVLGCAEPEPAVQVDDPCDALRGGASGANAFPVDLSAAHTNLRLFEPEAEWVTYDMALAGVLGGDADPFVEANLGAYAAAVPSTCAVSAELVLGVGSIEYRRSIAIVTPGVDDHELPRGTRVVVVDLREVAAGPETFDAVAAAAGLALASDEPIGLRQVRQFDGFPQNFETSAYESHRVEVEAVVSAAGESDLPLVFWTGQRTAPEAAAVAGGLRLAGRAWIVGYDIHTAVAQSTWTGVGNDGLASQTSLWLFDPENPWPAVIPADVATATPERVGLFDFTVEHDAIGGSGEEHQLSAWVRNSADPVASTTKGELRAGLLIMHGTLKRFFPHFDIVGDQTDPALVTALGDADANTGDRQAFLGTLGRFMHEIHDGHGLYDDYATDKPQPTGYLLIQPQLVGGEAVVRSSLEPGVEAGDTITSVDGVPFDQWLAEAETRRSAATSAYLFVRAMFELRAVHGTRTLGLRDPDGGTSTVTLEGEGATEADLFLVPWGGGFRPSGYLDDLGGTGIYYLNLNGDLTTSDAAVEASFVEAVGAAGLVVDMRDYPAVNHFAVARHLHDAPFVSPTLADPTWIGPDAFEWAAHHYDLEPLEPTYTGPVVLLVGNTTVSAAENFAQMIFQRPNVTVVGQTSAGTNGEITGVELPGRFYARFTGQQAINPDGSPHFGIGIVPDVEVTPTPAQFRDGVDPELMAAIDVLTP